MDTTVFSIITVCLNSQETIEQAILSVLNQQNFQGSYEHIIIDGVSKDNTLKIVNKYKHLKVISEPDKGLYDAMNKGIGMAKGKYIGILNSDDWYDENTLSNVYKAFQENPTIGVVHGNMMLWKNGKIFREDKYKDYQKYYCMWIKHPASFVSNKTYEKFGKFDLKYKNQADYELMLRFKNYGVEFKHVSEILSNFRIGGNSTINWSLKESIEVRTKNGMSLPWAVISAITVRTIFRVRLIVKEFFIKKS